MHATPLGHLSYHAPPRPHNPRGVERRVGLEVELGGLSLPDTLSVVHAVLGGRVQTTSRAVGAVHDTPWGKVGVEYDHSILRDRGYLHALARLGLIEHPDSDFAQVVEESLLKVAAEIVPVEVVTPPIPWSRLERLDPLWAALRAAGAKDTHASLLYAFGLHLNPELPALDASTLLSFMRAFLLLEDWLGAVSRLDISRRVSPFIRAFPEAYRRMVLAPAYAPDDARFATDYLKHNPTRNRPLDLHPMLVHIHGDGIRACMEEAPLVKPRPTFHYRLPNCELATPGWTPARDWNRWIAVERLAHDDGALSALSSAYLETLDLPLRLGSLGWIDRLHDHFDLPD
ncbi:MAG: amidoligase family protein [Polyangiales bacterium]